MSSSKTDWAHALPVSRIEMWIIRLAMVVFIFSSGFGMGYIVKDLDRNFEKGITYALQKIVTIRNAKLDGRGTD